MVMAVEDTNGFIVEALEVEHKKNAERINIWPYLTNGFRERV